MDTILYYPKFPLGKDKWTVAGGSNRMHPPLDMGWIGKLVEEKTDVEFKIIDANANRYSLDQVEEKLEKYKPRVILTTSEPYEAYRCMSLSRDYFSIHKENIEMIKDVLPESKVILIGPHGSALPDYVFKENPKLDIIVRGESEITSYKLIEALVKGKNWKNLKGISFREKGKIIHNENRPYLKNLDKLSYPAFHLLEMEKYLQYHEKVDKLRKTISVTSRGCPYQCIYCFKSMVGNQFRVRSVEDVLNEIDILYNKYNVEHISFIDETFTIDQERTALFSKKLKEKGHNLTWDCETRIECISKDLLKEMANSGLTEICFGVESTLPEIQKSANKIIDIKKVKEIVEYGGELGIYTTVALQLGLPGDSWETIEKNLEEMKKLDIPLGLPLITRVYPNTKLYEMAKEEGLIKEGNFQECIETSGIVKTGFKNREDYYKALSYYHQQIRWLNLRKKLSLQYIGKKIKRYGLLGTIKRGISVIRKLNQRYGK